jgi:hypothetical protein
MSLTDRRYSTYPTKSAYVELNMWTSVSPWLPALAEEEWEAVPVCDMQELVGRCRLTVSSQCCLQFQRLKL